MMMMVHFVRRSFAVSVEKRIVIQELSKLHALNRNKFEMIFT